MAIFGKRDVTAEGATRSVVGCVAVGLLLAFGCAARAGSKGAALKAAVGRSSQVILVRSQEWSANHGRLVLLDRASDGHWRLVTHEAPVMLGRNGLARGMGLYPRQGGKREGDGCSPAGVFELERTYGRDLRPPSQKFPYQPLSDSMEGIDDPASRFYNRLIDAREITTPDWRHAEKVRRSNPMFRWCVAVKHNWQQLPGGGSCIYLHIWKAPGVPTSGCTAMDAPTLERIVRWLDASKRPLLVQLPETELRGVGNARSPF